MFEEQFSQQSSVIKDLQDKLAQAEADRDNNKNAAHILTEMINAGDAQLDKDGNVNVSKRKSDSANIIGNMDE